MRGKCERGRGNINADGAGAEVFAGDGCSQGRLSAPWPRFDGVDRADVYIIIHVRACCCGECALNPPTSQPIPRRRLPLAPAQRHALPEHFLTPFPPRRTPAGCAMHSSPPSQHIPRRRPSPAPHSDTPGPSIFSPPSRALPLPHAAPTHARRLRDAFFADLTTHSPPKAVTRPRTATRPPRALQLPHPAPTHTRRPHNTFPAEDLLPPQHSDTPCPSTFSLPSRALPLPHAAPTHARKLRDAFLAESLFPSPQRRPASPSVPLRAQKNGTAQWMCDAECLGRPSLRSVIGIGEPRAVRRRCGALAWRVGLRPQPWALRSRRCGRVLRA